MFCYMREYCQSFTKAATKIISNICLNLSVSEFGGHGQPGSRTPLSALVRGHGADTDIIKNKITYYSLYNTIYEQSLEKYRKNFGII